MHALIIPEKRVVYVVSIVAYQDYHDRCRHLTRRNWIFTHEGLSAHAHNMCVQEVEVHGWLLSGIEELTILCCSFFFTLVAKQIASALVQG